MKNLKILLNFFSTVIPRQQIKQEKEEACGALIDEDEWEENLYEWVEQPYVYELFNQYCL